MIPPALLVLCATKLHKTRRARPVSRSTNYRGGGAVECLFVDSRICPGMRL